MPLGFHKVALFGVAGVDSGSAVLLSTATASDDASIEFTLPTAYKQVVFKYYGIRPVSDTRDFMVQANVSGESGYNETMTTTTFYAYHDESDSASSVFYSTGTDQAQGTSYQIIADDIGNDSDQCASGELILYNPASTTYVKHFSGRAAIYKASDYAGDFFSGGYFNVTGALDSVSFKMDWDNIASGTIKMWGIS